MEPEQRMQRYAAHRVRMSDTGIGKTMGFENDDAFRQHMDEVRASYPPEVRERIEEIEKDFLRSVLFGEQSASG